MYVVEFIMNAIVYNFSKVMSNSAKYWGKDFKYSLSNKLSKPEELLNKQSSMFINYVPTR